MTKHLLDDPFRIQKLDPENMMGHLNGAAQQCWDARADTFNKKLGLGKLKVSSFLICGVGGSAISGETLAVYLKQKLKIPVVVHRGYDLPAWVDQKTLVVCSSYSGDTEETLSILKQGLARKLNLVVLSSGGTLLSEARKKKIPYYEMPQGVQPRAMFYYSMVTILTLAEEMKLIPSVAQEVDELIRMLDEMVVRYGPSNPLTKNPAKQLAVFLHQKYPVLYSGESCFSAAAYRWKCQFNENAKQMAWTNIFSEMNHNEILAYTDKDSFVRNAGVLLLRSKKYDGKQIAKRFDIFKKIVKTRTPNVKEVWAEGSSLLTQTLTMVYLGDFVSVYLAFLKKKDPTPIGLINELKRELKKGK